MIKLLLSSVVKKAKEIPKPAQVTLICFACSIIRKSISFIAVPIYTRMVSTNQYGVYSLFQSWDSLLLIFATLSMWNYLINNGLIKYSDKKDGFISALSGLNITITVLYFIVYCLLFQSINDFTGLSTIIMVLMFTEFLFYPTYEYWCSRKRFEYDVKWFAVSSVVIAIMTPLISILVVLLFKNVGFENTGIGLIVGKVFGALPIYLIVFMVVFRKGRLFFDKDIWKYALKFNLPLIPHFLACIVLQQSDRIMIAKICGESEAGIYSVAYSIGVVMIFVNDALNSAIIPWTYQKLKAKKYNNLPKMYLGCLFIIALVNLMLSIMAPEIVSIMAPIEYRQAMYVIPPVAMSNVFILLFNFYANIEYFYEETKFVAFASVGSALLNIILNYVFVNKYGFVAAGYTTVICYIIYALCHLLFMKYVARKHSLDDVRVFDNKKLWGLSLSFLIITLLSSTFYSYLIIRISIIITIIALAVIFRKKIVSLLGDFNIKFGG